MIDTQLIPLETALKESRNFLLVLAPRINFDGVAAALSLYLTLQKAGRDVKIVSAEPMTVKFASLVGVDQVEAKLEGKTLIISFPYVEDSVEKVSWQIDENRFNVLVQPKEGFPPLPSKNLSFSYTGAKADCIFIFGFNSFDELGQLYQDNRPLFEQDRVFPFKYNPHLSYSEQVAVILNQLQLPVSVDIANNLIAGLERATRGFAPDLSTASTFEAAAYCMRWGGVRQKGAEAQPPKAKTTFSPRPPVSKPAPSVPQIGGENIVEEQQPPAEWLEPKILKSNTQV